MDLYAYAQIENLEHIMKANNIEVPRLRGLRLMKDAKPLSSGEIQDKINRNAAYTCERAIEAVPFGAINPVYYEFSSNKDRLEKKYLRYDNDKMPIAVRWDRVHGKLRKAMKYNIKKLSRSIRTAMNTWNKYAGREDVLYIHARLGSTSWSDVRWKDLANEPWFLDGTDDEFDSSYCDIYAKIDVNTIT